MDRLLMALAPRIVHLPILPSISAVSGGEHMRRSVAAAELRSCLGLSNDVSLHLKP